MSMETFTVVGGGFEAVPAGFYKADFLGYDRDEITNAQSETKTVIRFRFKVTEGEHAGKNVDGIADPVAKTTTKFGKWLAGLAGKPLAEGLSVTPSEYIGRRYMVIFDHNKNGKVTLSTFSPVPA